MLIIPAIDLEDGKVVRYVKGRLNKKVYSQDPQALALKWQSQGAKLLHVVDLDGAISGKQKNLPIIKKIVSSLKINVEVGGGIRSLRAIEKILDIGAKQAIIGTKAIEDAGFLKQALRRFGDKVVVGLDACGGRLGLYGWKKSSRMRLEPLLKNLEDLHLKTIIYTDISRDGTLKGINLARIKKILKVTNIGVIVSGGVSTLADIKKLLRLNSPNLKGVIIGKALYEERFTLSEAIVLTSS